MNAPEVQHKPATVLTSLCLLRPQRLYITYHRNLIDFFSCDHLQLRRREVGRIKCRLHDSTRDILEHITMTTGKHIQKEGKFSPSPAVGPMLCSTTGVVGSHLSKPKANRVVSFRLLIDLDSDRWPKNGFTKTRTGTKAKVIYCEIVA